MYKRIVLKLSGEVLAGPRGFGLDAGCPIHFTSYVKWLGNHEINPAGTVKIP
jgi:uridylate kinase